MIKALGYCTTLSSFAAPFPSYHLSSIFETLSWLLTWLLIIYDQAYKETCYQKRELIQYNAALAVTDALRGTSKETLDPELCKESLQKWRWYRKMCYFLQIFNGQSRDYLSKILPSIRRAYNKRNVYYIPCFITKQN